MILKGTDNIRCLAFFITEKAKQTVSPTYFYGVPLVSGSGICLVGSIETFQGLDLGKYNGTWHIPPDNHVLQLIAANFKLHVDSGLWLRKGESGNLILGPTSEYCVSCSRPSPTEFAFFIFW